MNRIILAILCLFSFSRSIGTLAIPTDYLTVTNGSRATLAGNFTAIQTWGNSEIKDSLAQITARITGYSGNLAVSSLGNLRLKLDADNSETAKLLVETSSGDSLFRVSEDSTAKFFGNLTVAGTTTHTGGTTFSSLTASLPVFTDGSKALTSNAVTGTGSVVMSAGPTLTGTMAAANGTYSGTLGVTGTLTATNAINVGSTQTNSEAIVFNGNGTPGTGRMYKSAAGGLSIRGIAGSTDDFRLFSAAAGNLIQNPTGTNDLTIAGSGGATTISGTLGITGEATASGGILFATGGGGAGRIYRSAVDGLIARAVAGSSNDFALISAAGNILLANPTGTGNLTVGYSSGGVTIPGTATTTGVHTFTAAPVFSSATASQAVFTNGSKALVSNAITGTGNVVMSTSPTLVTPALGAATATSIVASGNVTADSLISSKFYEEGTYTATITGCATSPTATWSYVRIGKFVCIKAAPLSATSNASSLTFTGAPASIRPSSSSQTGNIQAIDNGGTALAYGQMSTGGTMTMFIFTALTTSGNLLWTTSGTKGITVTNLTFTYTLQ